MTIASGYGRTETVSLLRQNGGDVNMQGNEGCSSLMIASQHGHTQTVLLLLRCGATINMQASNGLSALMRNNHPETVSLLSSGHNAR